MSIVCAACGTENRSVAKFCIECVAPLAGDFAATQVLAATSVRGQAYMPSALAAFASATSPPSMPTPMPVGVSESVTSPAAAPAPARLGIGIGVGVGMTIFALALAGVLGWLAARAQLWPQRDVVSASPVQVQAGPRAVSGVVAPSAGKPDVAQPAAPGPTPVEALAPGESIVPVDTATPSPAPVPTVVAALPTTEPAPPVAAASAKAPPAGIEPQRTQSLFARCEGLGFIAGSRCKVDLCTQAANRQRKECRAVLAQQRQMEEKRNPTMAN